MFPLKICFLAVFLVVATVHRVNSLSVMAGSCPKNMTAVKDFDLSKYIGKWYEYSLYQVLPRMYKCPSIEFLAEGNNTYRLRKKEVNKMTGGVSIDYADLKINPNNSKYNIVSKSMFSKDSADVYVLDTDYTSFSIHYSCISVIGIMNLQYASIFTRERMPSPDTVHRAEKSAASFGLSVKKLDKLDQDSCPKDA